VGQHQKHYQQLFKISVHIYFAFEYFDPSSSTGCHFKMVCARRLRLGPFSLPFQALFRSHQLLENPFIKNSAATKQEQNSNQARALLGQSNTGNNRPTDQPTNRPTNQPTNRPTDQPTSRQTKSLIEALARA
jgi:hypothetical protein